VNTARNVDLINKNRPDWMTKAEKRIMISLPDANQPLVQFIAKSLVYNRDICKMLGDLNLVLIVTKPEAIGEMAREARKDEEKWLHDLEAGSGD